jgi:hypothetical protein
MAGGCHGALRVSVNHYGALAVSYWPVNAYLSTHDAKNPTDGALSFALRRRLMAH